MINSKASQANRTAVSRTQQKEAPPKIVCPMMRILFESDAKHMDFKDIDIDSPQIRDALRKLGMRSSTAGSLIQFYLDQPQNEPQVFSTLS